METTIAAHLDAERFADAATAAIAGYGPQILGFLVSILGHPDHARDVFATFSEELWIGLPRFRRESTLRVWAYRIARHAALKFLRDPYWRRGARLDSEDESQLAAAVRSTTQAHLRPSADDKLARLRATLTPDEHALIILRVDRDLGWQEIADIMSAEHTVDASTLRKRFERLTEKLRKLAVEQGLL